MIGRELAGYRIEAQIGQGEIGVVYRALDLELSKPVALKLLRAEAAVASLPRFEQEAKALSALVHPNVVAILDCGVSDATAFVAMELLEGQTLAEVLRAGRLAPERARRVMRDVLSALAYVQGRGFLHGALKPGNIFLQRLADGTEQAKLLDFGLVKSGGEVDASADVHGAAVVCFEMLAGKTPSVSVGQHPPLLHEVCADRVAQPELERALQQALSPRASARQPTALQLDKQLQAVPEPWFYEGREATKERRKAAIAARAALRRSNAVALRAAANAGSTRPGLGRIGAGMTAELAHKLAITGAWSLSIVALAVIGITAKMFYLSRDSADPKAREAFERTLPMQEVASQDASTAEKIDDLPAAEPSEPSERAERVVVRAPRVPAQNPWKTMPIPRELRQMRWKIEIGQEGDREMLKELNRYARKYAKDARGPLLLARLYANRDAWNDAVANYKVAFERDPSSRGDPRMLKDLVKAVARTESSWRASELIPTIYGADALVEIRRIIARTHDNEERLRLEQLAHTLAP